MTDQLSRPQARRIALAAQGFTDPRVRTPTMRTLARTLARTGVLQVDSVNVLQRAHFMPLYSRMGPYDVDLLRRAAQDRPRRVVEYWAHVQAFMPVELWPAMAFRREEHRDRRPRVVDGRLQQRLLAELTLRGASSARDLDDGLPRSKDHWGWNWSASRIALDHLYRAGEVAIAGRTSSFEVRYDLPERVLPAEVLDRPAMSRAEQHLELVRRAARSHGVATARCLGDYYRMRAAEVRPAIATLLEAGELIEVRVEGWARPAYLHREARRPRAVHARALLSPFDPLVWERERTERLFDVRYRIEIYVPVERRVHGYYVLPFLLRDEIVARVDLKADRQAGALLVQGSYAEPGAPPDTAAELAAELEVVAGWLGLERIDVATRGDLAAELSAALAAAGRAPG